MVDSTKIHTSEIKLSVELKAHLYLLYLSRIDTMIAERDTIKATNLDFLISRAVYSLKLICTSNFMYDSDYLHQQDNIPSFFDPGFFKYLAKNSYLLSYFFNYKPKL